MSELLRLFSKSSLGLNVNREGAVVNAITLLDLIANNKGTIICPRHVADDTKLGSKLGEDYVHIIPYILVRKGGKYLTYRRKGSEGQLTGKLSIGIGGHATAHHYTTNLITELNDCIANEIEEEIGLAPTTYNWPTVQVGIYTEEDEVSKRHLGLIYILDVPADTKLVMSSETDDFFYCSLNELREIAVYNHPDEQLEAWSKLAIEHVISA